MDEAGDAEEFDWLRDPLPERPPPQPLRRWIAEYPVSTLTPLVAASLMLAMLVIGRPVRGHWVIVLMLGAWALSLALGPGGIVDRIESWQRGRERGRRPHDAWSHDRVWNERGETRSSFIRMAEALHARMQRRAYFITLVWFGAMFAVVIGAPRWVPLLVFGALLTWGACSAWRLHGAGDSHLSFTKFPFHTGETVTMHFGMSDGGAQFRRVEFHIYHVEEFERGWLATQRGTRTSFRGSEHHPPGLLPGPDFDVEVSFDVPADAPGTCLSAKLPGYWVLEVRGVTTSGPYVERFLVPIYARPEPAEGTVGGSGSASPARAPGGSS